MRNALISNQSNLGEAALVGYAQSLSLDVARFRTCLASDKYLAEIQRSVAGASAIDISGTPSFVLGKTTPEGVEGAKIEGALPSADFETKIKAWLAKTP
jgi:predicted DsbA family dithiol-disulfide isomerase